MSKPPAAGGNPPADIQAGTGDGGATDARFIALYDKMMEKQLKSKEATLPAQTDSQIAGRS